MSVRSTKGFVGHCSVQTLSAAMLVGAEVDTELREIVVMTLMSVQFRIFVQRNQTVLILQEVSLASALLGMGEVFVLTLTSALPTKMIVT